MWVLLYLSCQTTLPNPAEFNQKGVNGGYGWWRGWRLITCITDGRPMGNTRSAVSSLLLCYCSPLKGQQVRWSNCWERNLGSAVCGSGGELLLRPTFASPLIHLTWLAGKFYIYLKMPHTCNWNAFWICFYWAVFRFFGIAKNIHILPTFRGNSQGKKLFQLLCFSLSRNAATKLCDLLRRKNLQDTAT